MCIAHSGSNRHNACVHIAIAPAPAIQCISENFALELNCFDTCAHGARAAVVDESADPSAYFSTRAAIGTTLKQQPCRIVANAKQDASLRVRVVA